MKTNYFTRYFMKMGAAQILSAVAALFLPFPECLIISVVINILLGLLLFGEHDSLYIFCCTIITLTGAAVLPCLRLFIAISTPEADLYFRECTDFIILFMSIPVMSSGYLAILRFREKNDI